MAVEGKDSGVWFLMAGIAFKRVAQFSRLGLVDSRQVDNPVVTGPIIGYRQQRVQTKFMLLHA